MYRVLPMSLLAICYSTINMSWHDMAMISKYSGSGVFNWLRYPPILHKNQIESLWKQPTHDHEEIKKYWIEFGRSWANSNSDLLNMVVKHYNGCKECATIMLNTSMSQHAIISWKKRAVRRNKNTQSNYITFVMTCNEITMLPLLVAMKWDKSPFRKILRHSLYTRDVWRSVLLLATFRK